MFWQRICRFRNNKQCFGQEYIDFATRSMFWLRICRFRNNNKQCFGQVYVNRLLFLRFWSATPISRPLFLRFRVVRKSWIMLVILSEKNLFLIVGLWSRSEDVQAYIFHLTSQTSLVLWSFLWIFVIGDALRICRLVCDSLLALSGFMFTRFGSLLALLAPTRRDEKRWWLV